MLRIFPALVHYFYVKTNMFTNFQICISVPSINITENIRKTLDEGNIGCEVFVNLQKALDTVDHKILLAKLHHYGIHGVSNDWFKSYV